MTLTSGYFEFADNTTLDASELNGYLQQGVMVFDDASDRDTQLSAVLREGMTAYTKDDDTIRVYDGYGWLATDNPLITTPKTGASTVSLDRFAYWTYTSSGTLTVVRGGFVDVLCVGGGGAGGPAVNAIGTTPDTDGGGGGAGAVVEATNVYLSPGTYSIIIGAGGSSNIVTPYNGNASLFGSLIVSPGGGAGGSASGTSFAPTNSRGFIGGSGGGGGSSGSDVSGGAGFSGFGNAGGNGRTTATAAAGGGGGGGASGSAGASAVGGDGGDGVIKNYPPAAVASIYYGGGGGGGVASGTGGSGGQGGGGDGGAGSAGTAGSANTGGGGGGRGRPATGSASGASGGSGIVIVRMRYL